MMRHGRLALVAALATGLTALPATDALAKHARDGRFSGRTDQRFHGKRGKVVFTVGHHGQILKDLEINLLYDCPKYGQWPSKMVIRSTKIQYHSGIFLRTGNFQGRAYNGHKAKIQIRMAGRFTRSVTARGQIRALMSVITPRGVRETCAAVANFYGARRFG
jgi:hypothetical protein